jgi:hypothetical protein
MNPKIFIQKPAFNHLNIYTQIFILICLLFIPNLSLSQDLIPQTEKGPKKWLGIEFTPPKYNFLTNPQQNLKKGFFVDFVFPYGPAFGGRRFESSRPDQLKQGLSRFPLGPFLLWVTNEGQIGLNLSLSVIEWFCRLPLFEVLPQIFNLN